MTTEQFFLEAKYSRQKSFYNKAVVTRENDGSLRLYSYGTWVATIFPDDCYQLHKDAAYSNTTVRHVNEFLMQFTRIDEKLIYWRHQREDRQTSENLIFKKSIFKFFLK